ncbi:non-ribosomal peptide synthetase [Streptomyces profundus]|uniref:non-ribosomal peptide synthetase n=1 Tax=Streptomyces profundus TaxID=2867410 RepID=UPI001D15F57E|nr:non-ribosomal peptide synthetase [Streptomyces sp. MA3_2.13]UED88004.1 non-ribosomal peptide synthetase [Streptomyces sp. MA3_2.13]
MSVGRPPFSEPLTAHQVPDVMKMFRTAAARDPDAEAVASAQEAITYRALDREADAMAGLLAERGVDEGALVAVENDGTPRSIAALLGVWRASCAAMPLDPALTSGRRQNMLEVARPVAVITAGEPRQRDTVRLLPAAGPGFEGTNEPAPGGYVFFTSGSTGEPKAVIGTARGLGHFVAWQRDTFAVGPGDRFGQSTRWSFDVMLREVCTPLVSGATLCLPGPGSLDARRVFAFARGQAVTVLHVVPSLVRRWLRSPESDESAVPSLRATFFAGEPLEGALVRQWRERVSPVSDVVNLYGPTETTLAKCYQRVPPEVPDGPLPVGSPMPGCEVALMVPGSWERPAENEPGEIVLRTPYRSAGYLRSPAAFTPNPFRDDDSTDLLHRTGDLGAFDDSGRLHVLGRLDDQVKVRGVRIALGEVARALEALPEVVQASVVDHRVDGETRLAAYVTLRTAGLSAGELRRAVGDSLPTAAVPHAVTVLDELPLLPQGKVDRDALRGRAASSPVAEVAAPDLPAPALGTTAPDILSTVSKICAIALGTEGIADDADLFELGGDSMAALEIATALEEVFAVDIGLGLVFRAPTVGEIAESVASLLTTEGKDEQ